MDDKKFQDLYDRFAPMIYTKCFKILGNKEDAHDAMQEVSIKMMAHLDRFVAMDNQVAWLYRVSTNICLNQLRTRKRRWLPEWSDAELAGQTATQEAEILAGESLQKVLSEFSASIQKAIIYHYLFGMTQDEVAEMLGKSRMTISRWLRQVEQKATVLDAKEKRS